MGDRSWLRLVAVTIALAGRVSGRDTDNGALNDVRNGENWPAFGRRARGCRAERAQGLGHAREAGRLAGVVSGGIAPDLRASPVLLSSEAFAHVVRDGGLAPRGMPPFPEFTGRAEGDDSLPVLYLARGDDLAVFTNDMCFEVRGKSSGLAMGDLRLRHGVAESRQFTGAPSRHPVECALQRRRAGLGLQPRFHTSRGTLHGGW